MARTDKEHSQIETHKFTKQTHTYTTQDNDTGTHKLTDKKTANRGAHMKRNNKS